MIVAMLIYRKLTMSAFERQAVIDDEQRLLRNETDGPGMVNYGGGLHYHPTMMPPYSTMNHPPPGYDENDYKTLSTIQVRPIDPQLDLDLELPENETKKITIEDEPISTNSDTSSIQEDHFAEVKPLVKT